MGVPLDLSERLGEIWRQGWILALDLRGKNDAWARIYSI
jgi:hypothetical protein